MAGVVGRATRGRGWVGAPYSLGSLTPLVDAIPELAELANDQTRTPRAHRVYTAWTRGWGSPDTETKLGIVTQSVSYGYPGGMNVADINDVTWPPPPK
jgi:hypothetical protein